MARFDAYANPDGPGALLDVQADLLEALNTRIVVPLLPQDHAPAPARLLNPIFEIDGEPLVMVTQFMAAVPRHILGQRMAQLAPQRDEITRALDIALSGF